MNELDKKLIQKMDKNLDRKKKIAVKIENKEERSKQLWELAQSNSSLIKDPEKKVEKGKSIREWLSKHAKPLDTLIEVAEYLNENEIRIPDNVVEEVLFNEDENQTLYPIKDLTVGEFSEILTKKLWNTLKEKGYIGDDNILHVLVDDGENEVTETDSEDEKEDNECFKETKLEDSPLFVFNDIKLYMTVGDYFLHGEKHDIRIWKMNSENKLYISFTYVPDYYETNFIILASGTYNVCVSFNNEKPRATELGQFSVDSFDTTKEDGKVFYNITLVKDLN